MILIETVFQFWVDSVMCEVIDSVYFSVCACVCVSTQVCHLGLHKTFKGGRLHFDKRENQEWVTPLRINLRRQSMVLHLL